MAYSASIDAPPSVPLDQPFDIVVEVCCTSDRDCGQSSYELWVEQNGAVVERLLNSTVDLDANDCVTADGILTKRDYAPPETGEFNIHAVIGDASAKHRLSVSEPTGPSPDPEPDPEPEPPESDQPGGGTAPAAEGVVTRRRAVAGVALGSAAAALLL